MMVWSTGHVVRGESRDGEKLYEGDYYGRRSRERQKKRWEYVTQQNLISSIE